MSQYSIKDLEQLSGIKAHTFRIWETRYAILKPKRTATNIRYYDDDDLKVVLNIAVLNEHGYKISKIASMSAEDISAEVVKLSKEFCHYPDQIQSLTLAMIDLNERQFDKVLTSNIHRVGLERTMVDIVYPFFIRVGVLWQTGAINPAQEHFISNLIRQKLIVAIDGQSINLTPHSKKFMLFLPAGEMHEIPLLFANWLLKRSNHQTFYLGQNTPLADLVLASQIVKPDYLLAIFSGIPDDDIMAAYPVTLSQHFNPSQLLFTGAYLNGGGAVYKDLFAHLETLTHLTSFLKDLDEEMFQNSSHDVFKRSAVSHVAL